MFGFLNVNKSKGMTSHDVVAKLRRITKIKQIGHTGTLDPFAEGVLPICIGKSTRLIEYLNDDKEYLATVQFGRNTDTYDIDGETTETFNKKITREDLEKVLPCFCGEIFQKPPIYSAIKVNGKKLYDYARQGENVEIKERQVTISKLELVEFDEINQCAKLLVACSKGTYIRSIAFDIGQKLNCGAFLSALTRTKAGNFTIANSISLEELTTPEIVSQNIINPIDVLPQNKYDLTDSEKERVSHGMSISNKEKFESSDIVILIYSGKIYAVGEVEQDKIKIKKVLG